MMQSQGLGALMPQAAQQMAPQQADPQRLAAATNLVSSDAERQILDPRTLALIKYKDAIQAMQAADQMMAAAQPAPMPPTVAERTKLAAEQGIAGLASKLGAGIQQQGNNMQAQQMQQAMSGGLPQLPAPNMAGMAQGGIVGFQEGGRPEDKVLFVDELGNPIYASDVARAMNAGAIDETPEGAERRAQYAAMQGDGVNLRDLAQTPARQEPRDQTPAPSTTYGTGDRTGQGENLRGMAEGLASLIAGAAPKMPEMSEEELLSLTTSEGGGRRSRLPEMPEEELLALTTSEGSGEGSFVRDFLRSIGGNREEDRGPRSGSGGLPDISVGGTARDIGTLARSVVDASALPFAAYEAAGQYGPNLSEIASAVAAGYRGEEAPEVPGMFDRRAEGQAPTDASTAVQTPTATQGQAVGTPRVQPAQQGFTPAPESMSGGMREPTPVERLRAAAAENTAQQGGKDAVDALLEEEQQPRAGESASDRDARRRMLIAGLRGFGAQGLGGFAAGTAEEELRQEQEVIAEQERQRRAAMEDRELSLKDREVTLMDEIRRQQLDADIRQRAEQALLRLEALGSAEQQFVQEQIGERTANIDQLIQNMNLSLISGNVRGRDADALRNQILALQEQKANIIEEALINLQQPDRSAAIRAAEEAAYGSGGRGFNPEDFTVRQTSSQ
jgi:hypothetical protein